MNSYARTPPLVWKVGWIPSPTSDSPHIVPHPPLHYLQEKDVLLDFIYRVNSIGKYSLNSPESIFILGVIYCSNIFLLGEGMSVLMCLFMFLPRRVDKSSTVRGDLDESVGGVEPSVHGRRNANQPRGR